MDPDRFSADGPAATARRRRARALVRALQANLKHYTSPSDRAIRYAGRREGLREQANVRPILGRMFARLRTAIERLDRQFACRPDPPVSGGQAGAISTGRMERRLRPRRASPPHMHAESWANGVYYVEVPAVVEDESRRAGWLRVGPPPDYGFGVRGGWPERWIKPAQDFAVMMPSHFHHETRKLAVDARRICFAFQIYADPTSAAGQ